MSGLIQGTVASQAAAAERSLAAGQIAVALSIARAVAEAQPRHFGVWMWLGELRVRAGLAEDAAAAFEHAAKLNPGHAAPFTRVSTLRFRNALGPPPTPRAVAASRRIQCRALGVDGRFGNQLLQYAFLRLCARRYGLSVEVPDWIGRDLYDFDDPFPATVLPIVSEQQFDLQQVLSGQGAELVTNVEVRGYFCGSMAHWGGVRDEFRAIFQPGRRIAPLLSTALERLRALGKTLVAVHLRRGDFGYGRFWPAPSQWYLHWLREIWPQLDEPVLYVASDSADARHDFAEFDAVAADDLAVDIPGADFLLDFEILRAADVLAISNSSFSFVAALLNTRARTIQRPDPDRRALRIMDPWAESVLLDPAVQHDALAAAESACLDGLPRADSVVVRIGTACSPAAHAIRHRYPRLRLVEVEPAAVRAGWRSIWNSHAVDLLMFENSPDLCELLLDDEICATVLQEVDHVMIPAPVLSAAAASQLTEEGFLWRGVLNSEISPQGTAPQVDAQVHLLERKPDSWR